MNVLSQLYYSTKDKFKNHNEADELESVCFVEYIESMKKENVELKNENEILKETNVKIALENATLSGKVKELTDQLEISERLETDKSIQEDYYNVRKLERKQTITMIDKITDERNTYKEVINIMCDKFDISNDSVLDIIDDISLNKGQQIEKV